jgi:phosphoesterase RecJ-like protein
MPVDWRPLVGWIDRKQRILLTTHVRPDGDGIGSMKALAAALRQRGKTPLLASSSMVPERYDFLDPGKEIAVFSSPGDDFRNVDGLMVLDTGTWNQLAGMGEFIRNLPVERVVIDHHVTQDDLGATRYLDTTAEATGRLVYELVRALGVPLTPEIASPLFVAVTMDTGWFRHSNTTPATFALAAELVAAGAVPDQLFQQLYDRNTLGRMKLTGLVLDRLTLRASGRLAFSHIEKGDYAATGAKPPDTEDLVNYTLSVQGVELGALFMEQPRGGVKVSFRSRCDVNVAALAQQYGGGGHPAAAGATLETSLDDARLRVLQALESALA